MNRLARISGAAAIVVLMLGSALAGDKKGDKLLTQGRDAEARGDYMKALDLYQQALDIDPQDPAYQLSMRRARFQAGQMFIDRGQKLRKAGKIEEAQEQFSRALTIDPSSTVAEQESKRTREMVEREKRLKDAGQAAGAPEDRGLTPVQVARRAAEKRAAAIMTLPELKPINPQLSSLKMSNQPVKVLYETVGKLAGINVLFDSEFQDNQKRFSLDLSNTTLDEALTYLGLLTKTYWKPLSANTIFVINDNVTKRRDYEEHVTRVFYLQNISTAQELNEAMTVMRTITEVRKVFPFNSQNAIVVRGTADQVALAEKVLMDIDKPKSEVVVDVLVMEANKTVTRDLANTLMSAGKPGLVLGIGFVGDGSTGGGGNGDGTNGGTDGGSSTGGSVPLGRLGNLSANDWAVTLPGYLLQAVMSDRQTRLKQYPQVRATDGQKASLRLGDRYPYATGSFQPGVGAVGVSPLVSTQFQFADVGVNVDVTPRIHSAEEVSLQVELEISAIRERIDVGGLSQPVIGQRKVSHIVRVREGEVTVIGGLMQTTDNRTKGGVPGLVDIPGLGKFFASNNTEKIAGDLLVALVPHVVRSPDITPENLRTVATGTDQIWKVNYAAARTPVAGVDAKAAAPAESKPVIPLPGAPVIPGLGQPLPGQAPTEPPPAPVQPATTEPTPAPQTPPPAPPKEQAAPAEGEGPPGGSGVLLRASSESVAAGQKVTVTVTGENLTNVFSTPMRLMYDPAILKLVDARGGDFLGRDGQQVTFQSTPEDAEGRAVIQNTRLPGAGGVSGSGSLVTLTFEAVGPGASLISFEDLALRDSQLQPINVTRPSVTVTVK